MFKFSGSLHTGASSTTSFAVRSAVWTEQSPKVCSLPASGHHHACSHSAATGSGHHMLEVSQASKRAGSIQSWQISYTPYASMQPPLRCPCDACANLRHCQLKQVSVSRAKLAITPSLTDCHALQAWLQVGADKDSQHDQERRTQAASYSHPAHARLRGSTSNLTLLWSCQSWHCTCKAFVLCAEQVFRSI